MRCSKCAHDIRKTGRVCSRCRRAWHMVCSGYNQNQFRRKYSQETQWICNDCSFRESVTEDAEVEGAAEGDFFTPTPAEWQLLDKCRKLENKTKQLTSKLTHLTSENDAHKNKTERLFVELHHLKDTARMQSAAIRKVKIQQEVDHQLEYAKNLEIQNLFYRPDEDLKAVVLQLFSLLGCTLTAEDIDSCFRLPSSRTDIPKLVVLMFKKRARRDEVFQQYKANLRDSRKGSRVTSCVLAQALGVNLEDGDDGRNLVYVNQNLTPYFKRLLYLAKNICRRLEINYCWYNNCKVYIRYPNDNSPAMVIEAIDDLHQLSKFSPQMRNVVESELARETSIQMKSADKRGFQFPKPSADAHRRFHK